MDNLNLTEDVERSEGQIIAGMAMGDTHFDETDALFVQVSGVSAIFTIPNQYTNAGEGERKWGCKNSGFLWWEFLPSNEWKKEVPPWYYVVLKPGDGLAVPSRAYHAVYGTYDRIMLNSFLEPRWHRMQNSAVTEGSYWRIETHERKALRRLFFRTVSNLFENHGISLVEQGGFIEQ